MSTRPFSSVIALCLIAVLLVPSAFLAVPRQAHAIFGGGGPGLPSVFPTVEIPGANYFANIKTSVESTISAIKNTITSVASVTSAAANVAMQINAYVLQPLAFILSGNLMKVLTAGVIAFVIGKANGTGIPQFVVDVQKSLQTVSDGKALAFFSQFGRNSNSPFAGSITSALRNDYLSKTSLAGFWAANMNTLAASSPTYRSDFLTGNWSHGGVAAWFALTTQSQNNPYTFYPAAKTQLASLIGPGAGGATGARVAELSWGQGFMSWCGASDAASGATATDIAQLGGATGVNPGDACTNEDGTVGAIKTPGSVISATLNKVLGGQQDIITRMGNVGPEINGILQNIGTVMQTVNFATELLGGPGSGGLFGVDQPSGTNSTSRLLQYQSSPGYLGVTNSTVLQNSSSLPASGAEMTARITQYQSAWNAINVSATAASTTVASLITFCANAAQVAQDSTFTNTTNTQITAARAALTNEIQPVLVQVAAAQTTIATAQAMVQKIQSELNASSDAEVATYAADIQALQTMSPTASDVANVQQEAQALGGVTAVPEGSLTVTGGSLVDQMALISTNANALKASACTFVPPTVFSGGNDGF